MRLSKKICLCYVCGLGTFWEDRPKANVLAFKKLPMETKWWCKKILFIHFIHTLQKVRLHIIIFFKHTKNVYRRPPLLDDEATVWCPKYVLLMLPYYAHSVIHGSKMLLLLPYLLCCCCYHTCCCLTAAYSWVFLYVWLWLVLKWESTPMMMFLFNSLIVSVTNSYRNST